MKIKSRIVVFYLIAFLLPGILSCINSSNSSTNRVITSGMMTGFPKPGKEMKASSGNWEVGFFNNEFNESTTRPFIRTIELYKPSCELITSEGNQITESSESPIAIRFSFNKKGRFQVAFFGVYFNSDYTLPVRFIADHGTVEFISYARYSSLGSFIIDKKEDALSIINAFLNTDEIIVQFKDASSGFYHDPYDKIHTINVKTTGFRDVYSKFASLQSEWEKSLKNE